MTALTRDAASTLNYIIAGETKNPKNILVLLHGSGTDCNDMLQLNGIFNGKIPSDTLVLIPNGPHLMIDAFPQEQADAARQAQPDFDWEKLRNWFGAISLEGVEDDDKMDVIAAEMAVTAKMLNVLIDGQMKKYGLEEKNLVIYGFSAGGIAALNTGLQRHTEPCAAVISHSGYFYGVKNKTSQPPILLLVGDTEIATGAPLQPLHEMTKELLEIYDLRYAERICTNLGHGFNTEALEAVTAAIRDACKANSIAPSTEETPVPPRPAGTKSYKL